MKKFFLNKNNIIVVFGNVAISDTLHNPLFDNTEFVTNMMRFMNMEETLENEEALKAYLLPLINDDFQIAQQNEVRKEQLVNVEGGIFEVKNSALYVKGIDISLPNSMITKFSEILDKNDPKLLNKYINFWKWLSLNPDAESREDMINWVTSQNLPILDSGLIMTFRRVLRVKTEDYYSIDFITNLFNKLRESKKSTNVPCYGVDISDLEEVFKPFVSTIYPAYEANIDDLYDSFIGDEDEDNDVEDWWSKSQAIQNSIKFFIHVKMDHPDFYTEETLPLLPEWFNDAIQYILEQERTYDVLSKRHMFLYPRTVKLKSFIVHAESVTPVKKYSSVNGLYLESIMLQKEKPYFTDNHTRKEKYYIGIENRMPREEVDPNKENFCSQGFHTAGLGFAYRGFGDTPVACLVNPKDVLVVYENDYGKCRTSAFTIVGVLNSDCEWADDAEILNEISRAYNYQLESLEKELAERSTVVGDPYYNRNKMTFMEDIISNTDYTTTVNRFNMLKSYVS
jgi:hypothetical protein